MNLAPGGKEPARLFTLSPKSTFSKQLPTTGWHLNVEMPSAGSALGSPKIALRKSAFALDYYARATWIDRAPAMVQTLLVESFSNTGKIVSVTGQALAPRADYALVTELREFQAEYDGDGPPAVRVRINAKLVQLPRRTMVAATSAERSSAPRAPISIRSSTPSTRRWAG
ncbi:MAG: membrane integrity-associated transporter subunit PqiC [Proteobacteria bacterium]|nr:membrane integrity-associated transporter subunit PqiC [Pseudomonadota bacterium]